MPLLLLVGRLLVVQWRSCQYRTPRLPQLLTQGLFYSFYINGKPRRDHHIYHSRYVLVYLRRYYTVIPVRPTTDEVLHTKQTYSNMTTTRVQDRTLYIQTHERVGVTCHEPRP
jgi:hypothetical protein